MESTFHCDTNNRAMALPTLYYLYQKLLFREEFGMINLFTLKNQIRVVCETMPYLRSVALGIWINVGSAHENEKNNGISHVIEHMVFKGTKSKTAKEIADITAELGGNLNAFTGKECTAFYIRTLDEQLFRAVELLGDMLQNSLIEEKDLEREKSVILDEIDMYEDSAEDIVHEVLQKEVWKNHPLGYIISGEKEVVKKFTVQEVREFMKEFYTGENIIISVAGNFDPILLKEKLEQEFGGIPVGKPAPPIQIPHYSKSVYKKERDIEQVHMDIAFPFINATSKDRYTASVVNSVLGGSVNSRLFQRIREDLGMVYTIYSYGCSFQPAGLLQIYAAMNPNQVDSVLEETIAVIEKLKKDGIGQEELLKAKAELKTELIISNESTQNRMESNAKSLVQFGKILTIDEILEDMKQVTVQKTSEFAEHYLDCSKISLAIAGNIRNS